MPGHFTPRKEPQYPLNRRLCGPHSWSKCFGKREKSLAPPTLQSHDCPVQSSHHTYTILAQYIKIKFSAHSVSLSSTLTLRLLMSYIYGVHILDVSRSHTTMHHNRYDSSGRVISSSQRPLPDNTRHSQQTNIHAPGGIRTHDLSR